MQQNRQEEMNRLMQEYYVPFDELAIRLGISKRTLTRKFNGNTEWTYKEMMLLTQIFNIQDPQAFFFGE
ncbi:MAG: hypothetical protein ACRCWY_04225 [Cellulosilyticaceae bacterium]